MESCVERIVLIDGDSFESRNGLRQLAMSGGKAVVGRKHFLSTVDALKASAEKVHTLLPELTELESLGRRHKEARADIQRLLSGSYYSQQEVDALRRSALMVTALANVKVEAVSQYLTPANMEQIMPAHPERVPSTGNVDGKSVIFLCVDNKKTRYQVSKYAEKFDDVLVVNCGNDKTTGHVTVYERRNGVALDPNLYEVYGDITEDADLRPDERPCTDVAPKHDQIAITNAILSELALSRLVTWARNGLTVEKKRGDHIVKSRANDILVDIEKPSLMAVYHPRTEEKENASSLPCEVGQST